MAELPTAPTKTCPSGYRPIAVVLIYKKSSPLSPPEPIKGATVYFQVPPAEPVTATTNELGLAQECTPVLAGFTVDVQHHFIDFGSGVGVKHRIATILGLFSGWGPWFFGPIEAKTPPPTIPIKIPCTGTLSAYVPGRADLSVADAIADILSGVAALPSSISVFISSKVGDGAQVTRNIPIEVSIDGHVVPGITTSGVSFDVIRVVQDLRLDIGVGHTVRVISKLLDCNIPEISFSIPRLVPGLPPLPVPCPAWATEAVPSVPSILQVPFTIGISGANWVCTPTGERTPIDAVAEVLIAGSRFSLPIRSGVGSLTLDQSRIAAILAGVIIPPPPPPPVPLCEKTGRIGEPGRYLVPLSEVQAFLNQCFPGGVAAYAPPGDPWTGAFKITRGPGGKYPAGSYFWAIKWEDIRGLY